MVAAMYRRVGRLGNCSVASSDYRVASMSIKEHEAKLSLG